MTSRVIRQLALAQIGAEEPDILGLFELSTAAELGTERDVTNDMRKCKARMGLGGTGAGLIAVMALAACGGEAATAGADTQNSDDMAEGEPSTTATMTGVVGGSAADDLPSCDADSIRADATVSDATGQRATVGTNGKVKVSVISVEDCPSGWANQPAVLKTMTYGLHGTAGDWKVEITTAGLTSELIEVGDTLDFQLETPLGYIPFTTWYNQVFGLFSEGGQLLVFAAALRDLKLEPDLTFLGLSERDAGKACRYQTPEGGLCHYVGHSAELSAGASTTRLLPGQANQLDSLRVTLANFRYQDATAGSCEDDDSDAMTLVGAALPHAK